MVWSDHRSSFVGPCSVSADEVGHSGEAQPNQSFMMQLVGGERAADDCQPRNSPETGRGTCEFLTC